MEVLALSRSTAGAGIAERSRADTWRSGPALPLGRTGALAFNHEGKIVVVGGRDMSGDAMTVLSMK